ncbi:MAG: hypothetical protein NC092_13100 [Butyrivibrio sp.]|nr:hypothetical protein [Muribaculum sp.]MCM1553610.1 hypothetical protein [Butyrivibrio sp.]
MNGILLNVAFVTLVGIVILIIRKVWGEAIHPQVLKCLWILFFICALCPMSSAAPLGQTVTQQVEGRKLSEIYSWHHEEYSNQAANEDMDNMDRYRVTRRVREVLPIVWAVGVIAVLLYKVAGAAIFYHKSRADYKYTLEPSVLEEKGISLSVPVRITENTGPMVLGVMGLGIRPEIYVPERFLNADGSLFQSIVLHEREHIARRHHLLLLLINLVGSVYWFLPYVEGVFLRALREDMEYRCDYELIRNHSVEAKEYARHCIAMAQDRGRLCNELSFAEGRLIRRVRYIQHNKKKTALSLAACIAAGITVLVCAVGTAFYYKRDIQGFTRWEVEAAKEALVCYIDACNGGKEEEIGAWAAKGGLAWDGVRRPNTKYAVRVAVYDITYRPDHWLYYRATRYMDKQGLDKSNCIYFQATYEYDGGNGWDHGIIPSYFFYLVREDKHSQWKVYFMGIV